MDNYYSSLELEELHFSMWYCQSSLQKFTKSGCKERHEKKQNKKGDCIFRQNNAVLCFRWKEKKKPATMLMTIHEAVFVEMDQVDRRGNKIEKPKAVY